MREIRYYPDKILRKKSEPVKEITADIKQLCSDMAKIMEENKGIGLAAPQVGELKRIIVLRTDEGPKAFINPKIILKSNDKEVIEEGFRSFL